jgi:histidinol-phosphatase (PHP family)
VDIAETNGEVKPLRNIGVLSDMHTHSDHSHDCKAPMRSIYAAERERGIKIMAIADHYDGFMYCDEEYDTSHIRNSIREADQITAEYDDDGFILRGIELGEGHWHPEKAKQIIAQNPFDVVVGAVHAVHNPLFNDKTGLKRAFSQLKYDQLTVRQTYDLIDSYYNDTLEMVRTLDIDICAHLTCVVGYFMTRHNIYVDVRQFEDKIRQILQILIDKGIALEVNFSGYPNSGVTSPHKWIIELYRQMGGYLICMATDAHSPGRTGVGYDEGVQILKDIGFRHVFYYKDRKPVQCTLL